MIKVSHNTLAYVSGTVWLLVGIFLLQLGLRLMLDPSNMSEGNYTPLLSVFSGISGGFYESAVALIAIGLYIGYLKGKYVLGKSARQGIARIRTFPNPTELNNIYSAKYYILLAFMIGLGLSMKYLGLPNDVRGGVDIAIGAALINGAMVYFKFSEKPSLSAQ